MSCKIKIEGQLPLLRNSDHNVEEYGAPYQKYSEQCSYLYPNKN
jgi:hypothetical protein